MAGSKRIIRLDIARTFAILCVVLCHCCDMTYYYNDTIKLSELGMASQIFMIGTQTIGRLGVPIFLMISGALLFKKIINNEGDILRFYKNNLLPLLIVNEVWVILYELFNVFVLKQTFVIDDFIKELLLLKNSTMSNMWYMPMILGVYIGVPFVAVIVKKFSFRAVAPVMGAIFIFSYIVPMLNVISKIYNLNQTFGSDTYIPYMGATYGLYMLIGYYIYNNRHVRLKNGVLVLISLCSYAITLYVQLYSLGSSSYYFYKVWYDFPFLLICSSCIFALFCRIDDNRICVKLSNVFTYISRISMGIFFVHVLIISIKVNYMGQFNGSLSLETVIMTVVTTILSIMIIWLFGRSRLLARYMFLIK